MAQLRKIKLLCQDLRKGTRKIPVWQETIWKCKSQLMHFTMVNFVYLFYTIVKGFYLSKLLSVTSTNVTYQTVFRKK